MNQEQFEITCGSIVVLAYLVPLLIVLLIAIF